MKTALFIGRFQPFHLGHYSVLTELVSQGYEQIYIGIGSAQYQRSADNPLSVQERRRCIEQTVQSRPLAADINVLEIPDIHNDAAWVDHVEKILYTVTTQYDLVVTGNAVVERLFKAAGKTVQPIQQTVAITGSQIRSLARRRDMSWQQYVDSAIISWIEPIILNSHGPDRTQNSDSSLS